MEEKGVRAQLRREILQVLPILAAVLFGVNHGPFTIRSALDAGMALAYFAIVFLADRNRSIMRFFEHPMTIEAILQVCLLFGSIALLAEMIIEPAAVGTLVIRSLALLSSAYIFEYRNLRRLLCAFDIIMGIAWFAYSVAQGEQLLIQNLFIRTGDHWSEEDSWKVRGVILIIITICTCIHLRYLYLRCKLVSGTDVINAHSLAQIVPDVPHPNPSQEVSNAASPNSGEVSIGGRASANEKTTHANVANCKAIVDQEKRNDKDPQPLSGGAASSEGEPPSTAIRGEMPDADSSQVESQTHS